MRDELLGGGISYELGLVAFDQFFDAPGVGFAVSVARQGI